jgi:A/G-specific adenine glycosylase
VERHGGAVPESQEDVLALPGVGRYTAGAIRSIAHGRRAPIVDGNVARVLARVFAVEGDVSRAATSKRLWALAEGAVAAGEPGEVNQAQMELGALVCTPASPRCGECPLESICVARRDERVAELPELPAKRATVEVRRTALLVRQGDRVLLRRRRDDELLPGLWDVPGTFTGRGGDVSTGPEEAAALLPFGVRTGETLGTMRHAITYRRIELVVVSAAPDRPGPCAATGPDGAELAWREPPAALGMALSSPARRILRRWGPPARS